MRRGVNWVAMLVVGSGALLAMAQSRDAAKPGAAAAAGTAPREVVVAGEHLEQTSRCEKRAPMRITANDSRISVLGDCTRVVIEGSRNWVLVDQADVIDLRGDLNTVLYSERQTRVEDRGKGNAPSEHYQQ